MLCDSEHSCLISITRPDDPYVTSTSAALCRHIGLWRSINVPLIITGRYCFYLVVQKWFFFAPQGRHVAPINVQFGTGSRPIGSKKLGVGGTKMVRRSAPPCQISRLPGQNFPRNFKFWPSWVTCLHNFYEILSFSTRL